LLFLAKNATFAIQLKTLKSMKFYLPILALFSFVLLFSSCEPDKNNDPQPEEEPTILVREGTTYDLSNKIIGYNIWKFDIKTNKTLAIANFDENKKVTYRDTFELNTQGQTIKRTTERFYLTSPEKEVLTFEYNGDKLIKSRRYINDKFDSYYTVEYNAQNYESKYNHYDANDNLTNYTLFEYNGSVPYSKQSYFAKNGDWISESTWKWQKIKDNYFPIEIVYKSIHWTHITKQAKEWNENGKQTKEKFYQNDNLMNEVTWIYEKDKLVRVNGSESYTLYIERLE
jgi:hypothetical protein